MPFRSSSRGAYGPQGQKVIKGPLAPVWTTFSPPNISSSSAYSYQFVATDDSGDAPTYSLASGSVPTGLSLSSAGLLSGTASASGSFTFNVRATDVNGRFTDSGNITITVSLASAGGTLYQTPGTYSWVAPSGVTSVSVVAIGGGGAASNGNSGNAGGGGGLGWRNSIAVTPGQSYTVVVADAPTSATAVAGGTSYFINTSTVAGFGGNPGVTGGGQASGGTYAGQGGGNGGAGGTDNSNYAGCGGGGAGGYSGNGGQGGGYTSGLDSAGNGAGGGGGGGGSGNNTSGPGSATGGGGGGGGGVGVYGQGSNGAAGFRRTSTTYDYGTGGGGGSGGSTGGNGRDGDGSQGGQHGGNGGAYGGGMGSMNGNQDARPAGKGAVRIIWGSGVTRSFPSTNVGQDYLGTPETVI